MLGSEGIKLTFKQMGNSSVTDGTPSTDFGEHVLISFKCMIIFTIGLVFIRISSSSASQKCKNHVI